MNERNMLISKTSGRKLKMIPAIIALILISSFAGFAQSNFSGTWALNESKSNLGEGPRMGGGNMVVTQSGNNLSVERTMQGPDGETKMTDKYTLDGKVSENPMFNSSRKSTVTWSADKSSITIASTMVFDMGGETMETKTSETWKLADGGKGLTVESSFSTPNGDMKSISYYDKK